MDKNHLTISMRRSGPSFRPIRTEKAKLANQAAKRQARIKTFQNQKHKITFSLFLVCLCFIVIIIPQTSIQLINYFTSIPVDLILNIYSITEVVYLMNFVINPIIFTYNNGYLMGKFQNVLAVFKITQK